MTTQFLTPIDLGETTKVGGRLFRKQVLPYGSINYKDKTGQQRKINFTRSMFTEIEKAFRDKCFPGVPLVFCDSKNDHTMETRATTGEVVDMEIADDGLYLIARADDDAAKLLSTYPNLGISARMFENLERADGKFYPAAIQHALITWDPKVPDLRPWEAVNLSSEQVDDTIDLTHETFAPAGEREGVEMAEMEPLTDEELRKLRAVLAAIDDEQPPAEDGSDVDDAVTDETDQAEETDESGDTDDNDLPELTDEELDALAAEVLGEAQADAEQSPAEQAQDKKPAEVAASNTGPAVELANARVAEVELQLANMQRELDARNFERERDKLAHAGVPPFIVDLARPLLQGSNVIELSNGETTDAGKVMRDVLGAVAKFDLLDLSRATGVAFESQDDQDDAEARREWSKDALKSMGIK